MQHSSNTAQQHQEAQQPYCTVQPTLKKPYSVSATKAMGAVEMNTPAMGMKLQMKTNKPSRPIPGIFSIHMPSTVKAVLAIAICACSARAQHWRWHTSKHKYSSDTFVEGAEFATLEG